MSKNDFSNKKLFNGKDCHDGMKVAPFVIENRKVAIEIGVKPEFIETYHLPNGKPYLVSFVEVPEEEFISYMEKNYSQQIRDFFDDYGNVSYKEQFSRCTINGEVCALFNRCSSCKRTDDQGNFLKNNKKGMLSLDESFELPISDEDVDLLFEDLLEAAGKLKDYYPSLLKKLREGYSFSEIVSDLPVKKTQAYEDFKKLKKFVEEFLK